MASILCLPWVLCLHLSCHLLLNFPGKKGEKSGETGQFATLRVISSV